MQEEKRRPGLTAQKKLKLNPREREVLALRFMGRLSSKEVAYALGIAPRTVRFHMQNIKTKNECQDHVDLCGRFVREETIKEAIKRVKEKR